MPIKLLKLHAKGESTYIVTLTFIDQDGVSVTPTSCKWTLTDSAGEIVNHRENIVISNLSSNINIVLYGDDLEVDNLNSAKRRLNIIATYTSLGQTGLPINDAVEFYIDRV